MRLSLGIVTYNRPDPLERTLRSLSNQNTLPEELVIVDDSEDNSSEAVVAQVRDQFDDTLDIVYHRRESGDGMADARNVVLDIATGDVLAFVDDDVVFPAEWAENLREAFDEFPDAAAIGGPALDVDDDCNLTVELLRTPEPQNWINEYGEQDSKQYCWMPPDPVRVGQLSGANMAFRTDVLRGVGGFNPVYRGPELFEETDVMGRLWKRGEEIIYDPRVALYHLRGGLEDNTEYWYWVTRNGVVFRHEVFPERFGRSLLRILLYTEGPPAPVWKQLAAYALDREPRHLSILKGYFDGVRQVYGLI